MKERLDLQRKEPRKRDPKPWYSDPVRQLPVRSMAPWDRLSKHGLEGWAQPSALKGEKAEEETIAEAEVRRAVPVRPDAQPPFLDFALDSGEDAAEGWLLQQRGKLAAHDHIGPSRGELPVGGARPRVAFASVVSS
jgi:hypothetical protein